MSQRPEARPELRTRLLDAGRVVLARVGHAAATVDDVIVEAGTSRASFYRYFKNKDDLFLELSRECLRDLRATMADFARLADSDDRRRDLEHLLARYGEVHARHSGVFRAWWERNAALEPSVRATSAGLLDSLIGGLEEALVAVGAPTVMNRRLQATLLYTLIERSSYAVSSRWSRTEADVLPATLATIVDRACFGAQR